MGGGGGDKFGKVLMYKGMAGGRLLLYARSRGGLPHFRPVDERKMNSENLGIGPGIVNNDRGLLTPKMGWFQSECEMLETP
jgi:hypothetical protein